MNKENSKNDIENSFFRLLTFDFRLGLIEYSNSLK